MKKPKLPSLSKVKKTLYNDWALRVKQRDNWACLLCGRTDNLNAHHWCVCDHHAHAARYCVHNGATLCYTCHNRGVHFRADWVTVQRVALAVRSQPGVDEQMIRALANIEVTTDFLRVNYEILQNRPVDFGDHNVKYERKKLFVIKQEPHISAVPGNTVRTKDGIFVVTTVAPIDVDVNTFSLYDIGLGPTFTRYGLEPFVERGET